MLTHLSDGPRPTDSTVVLEAHLKTARRRPMDPTARSRVKVTTVHIWPMVVAATSKPGKKKTRK